MKSINWFSQNWVLWVVGGLIALALIGGTFLENMKRERKLHFISVCSEMNVSEEDCLTLYELPT